MSVHQLMQTLGPETCKQMIRDADAEWETANGLFAEDADVCAEDQPWPVVASLCDDIPLDPFRQLSGDEE